MEWGSARGPDCPSQSGVAHGIGLIPVSVAGEGEQVGGGVDMKEETSGTPRSDMACGRNALENARRFRLARVSCATRTYVHVVTTEQQSHFARSFGKIVRTPFAAKDPVLSCSLDWYLLVSGLRFTQSDYTAKILEDAVNLGFGPIRICTTAGLSGTPPDPKMLPAQPCDPGVRELIESLKFLSRCASFDISFVVQQLAGLVTRWCEWARKEIRHIPGFVAHSAEWSLITKSADDDWEELTQHLLRCVVSARDVSEDTQSS